MFRELLVDAGLIEPTESDIINKLMKKNFTSDQLRDLNKVGPIIIKFYSNSNRINELKFDYRNNKCEIGFLYNPSIYDIKYTNIVYLYPTCDMISKCIPEIMDAIEEVKRLLPGEVSKYNENLRKKKELQDQGRTCRTKLWEYVNNK